MADPQLLTKQLIIDDLEATEATESIRFNLQRGKIARIWGFLGAFVNVQAVFAQYSIFVRKTPNAERATTPSDLLASFTSSFNTNGAGFTISDHERTIMFPKPYRTSGITVQMHASFNSTARGLLIIYYDIDDVERGELAQRWEKSRAKKYDRRALAP